MSHVYGPVALAAAGVVLLAGCGGESHEGHTTGGSAVTPVATSGSTPVATPSAAPSATPAGDPSSEVATLDVTIAGKAVDPKPATVRLSEGESLTFTVTSDVDNRLHVHGFEIERPIEAGKALSITVKGRQAGSFEVETHDPKRRLFTIVVT